MGCLNALCASYLGIFHTIVGIAGLTLTILSSIGLANSSNHFYGLPVNPYFISLGVGMSLFIVSMMACLCIRRGNIGSVVSLGIFQFVLGSSMLVFGAFLIVFSTTYLKNIVETPVENLTYGLQPGTFSLRQKSADFLLGMHFGCCFTEAVPSFESYKSCTVTQNTGPCYINEAIYRAAGRTGKAARLTSYCSASDEEPEQDLHIWLEYAESVIRPTMLPSGIVFTVSALLVLLAVVGTCFVGFSPRNDAVTGDYGSGI